MQQQPFRASRMLQYEWRLGHAVASDDANSDVPENDKNLLVPDPVKQQHIVQDSNPFTILANDEDSENDNDKSQQVLPDQIKNQGAEDTTNTKKNDFKRTRKIKERSSKFKEREKITKTEERRSRLKMYLMEKIGRQIR